ncbi:MAG: low molecular weight protein arginine phosphatase [Anaerolineaceae bacterium]|nr:MAG: low molecular weight protein arginine phosphatase [Chloroflexi bacterium HGW-Chloroflexi-8]
MVETKSVLFVCTANQCRSPMAEAILRRYLNNMDPNEEWIVESAGTWTQEGFPATPFGVKVMAESGLDTSKHKSQPISNDLLQRFSLILTMESGHKEAIQIEFPHVANRVYLLSEMAGEIVPVLDPIGGTYDEYVQTAKEIDTWIIKGLPKILELI